MYDPIVIVASITGLVGALTGLAGVWITYLNYTRDNIKVVVRGQKNMKIMSPGGKSSKVSYLLITASNAGRRTVIITMAAFINLKSRGGGISSSSMLVGDQVLNEGKVAQYLIEEDEIDYTDVSHVAVYDSVGNEYRYNIAAWYLRFYYWLLDVTHIRRKQMQAPKKMAPRRKSTELPKTTQAQ